MSTLKEEFKNWLVKQGYKERTSTSYIQCVTNAYKKNFISVQNKDWGILSENLLPLLVKYYELSNKEYYIDRVTIYHALDYFSQIANFINTAKQLNHEPHQDVELYFYCYEGDFYIDSVSFEEVRDYTQLFNSFCYRQDDKPKQLSTDKINNFLNKIKEIIKTNNLSDTSVYDVAIHIIYKTHDVSREKTALSRFCSFLYDKHKYPQYNLLTNQSILFAQKLNPNATSKDNYEEVTPITGEKARQVRPKINVKRNTSLGFIYSLRDLSSIFDVDFYTAQDLMNRYGKEFKIKTSIDDYYSADATNNCLKAYHHYKDKKTDEIYTEVDYGCKGYKDNWYTRKEAMKKLDIKKAAFYKHIYKKCLYIDYAKNAPRYYRPEIEYLAKTEKIKYVSKKSLNARRLSKKRTLPTMTRH